LTEATQDGVLGEMTVLDAEQDAFGRALLDHHEGRPGLQLMLEADDGSIRPADLQPKDFFLPHEAWPWWEQRVLSQARGAVLDLGAGAGRHSLHLQSLGHRVTAVDTSPGAVEVCRARGIGDVRLADLTKLVDERTWDTILLMCGNLGLAGDWEPTRRLLMRLRKRASRGGILIGDSVDPTSDDPVDLAYEERNRVDGFHRGYFRLRLHYGDLVTPWWDQINFPPADIQTLVEETGWTLDQRLGDADAYVVVLRSNVTQITETSDVDELDARPGGQGSDRPSSAARNGFPAALTGVVHFGS
jgi:SAM-dependent methyltransferase